MAGKIKFPLKMGDGAEVRTIEELREHFDLAAVLGYYENGKLAEWLIDRYYEVEAEKIKALDSSSNEFKRNLCEIFEVPYSEAEADDVDLAKIAAKNGRYERLKQFTADDTILAAVDSVAFSQEELADLLDEDAKLIYLCGKRFKIPCSKGGVAYIGVNNPVVDVDKGYDEKGIVFKGVQGENIVDEKIKSVFIADPNSFSDLPNDTVKKAAENGNINAQLELARRYGAPEHSPCGLSNLEQSEYWYKKALSAQITLARNGDLNIQLELGEIYLWGNKGADKDENESSYWYHSAFNGYKNLTKKENAEAQYSFGICFECGFGTDEDMNEAVYWLEKSAKHRHSEAMYELSQLYENDEYDVYDIDKAEYWANQYAMAEFTRCKEAAEQGDALEQSLLGNYYADGKGTQTDIKQADYWYRLALTGFKKAADQGDSRAQMQVARCYYTGEGVQIDKHTAFMWFKKAAEQENNRAMKIIGDCYKTGDGAAQNETEYIRCYTKAAKQGNADALFVLTMMAFNTSMDELTNTISEAKDSFERTDELRKTASEVQDFSEFFDEQKELFSSLFGMELGVKDSSKYTGDQFRLIVDAVSGIPFAGIVAEGVIETGSVRTLDEVVITKNDGSLSKCYVVGIEMFHKNVDYAEEGDKVGLLLKGVKSKEISKGAVVTKN